MVSVLHTHWEGGVITALAEAYKTRPSARGQEKHGSVPPRRPPQPPRPAGASPAPSPKFVLSSMVFSVVPTALEIGLVGGILAYNFGAPTALTLAGMVGAYLAFTMKVSFERIGVYVCLCYSFSSSSSSPSQPTPRSPRSQAQKNERARQRLVGAVGGRSDERRDCQTVRN